MNAQVAIRYISEEEYREAEETSTQKHEWFNGELFPVPGGTNNHTLIIGNLYFCARVALVGSNYEARNSNKGSRSKRLVWKPTPMP